MKTQDEVVKQNHVQVDNLIEYAKNLTPHQIQSLYATYTQMLPAFYEKPGTAMQLAEIAAAARLTQKEKSTLINKIKDELPDFMIQAVSPIALALRTRGLIPDQDYLLLTYAWSANFGKLHPEDRSITLDTNIQALLKNMKTDQDTAVNNSKSGTAVMLHGMHLFANDWENIILGDLKNNILGRIPTSIIAAWDSNAKILLFGNGVSVKNDLSEAGTMIKLVEENANALAKLCETTPENFLLWFNKILQIEYRSIDTYTELTSLMDIGNQQSIKKLILVSSPTHIARTLNTALNLTLQDQYQHYKRNIQVAISDVSYEGYTTQDVTVIEPPHRGDMPQTRIHEITKKTLPLMRDLEVAQSYQEEWGKLVERHLLIQQYGSKLKDKDRPV